MHRRAVALLASSIAAFTAAVAGAQVRDSFFEGDRPLELTADTVEYESQRGVYVASGNVRIVQGGTTLTADWMAFNPRTRRGVASGRVLFDDGSDLIDTEFIEFDLDSLHGSMFDAAFRSESPQFRAEGEEIRKTGDEDYEFKKGVFTTCRCPDDGRDPWTIKAAESELEIGGYGKAKNTTIEVLGVPVLWLPWMLYPIKTERESGLLFPEFGFGGKNGFEIGLPIFWAATDALNVTFTPQWLQKRGPKGDLELEYVFGEHSRGDLWGAFVWDEKIDPNSNKDPFERSRWQTGGRQDIFLPGGVRLKGDFQFVSDNEYPVDFDDIRTRRSNRYIESDGFAFRNFTQTGQLGLMAGARFADDMQNPDDIDRDLVVIQRLPEARFAALPGPAPFVRWLVPSLDVQYVRFDQRSDPTDERPGATDVAGIFLDTGIDGVADPGERGTPPDPHGDNASVGGPEGDGVFQEGEIIADRGHRMLFTPRIGSPWRIADLVELFPEVGWHQTLYGTHEQDFEQRGLLTARADLRTRLRGELGSVTHLLEPRLGYALVSDHSQSDNPLFIPQTAVPQVRVRELSLDNVTLDPSDRIREFNGLTFGFGNRFYADGAEGPVLLADLTVMGAYEFHRGRWGEVFVDGRAFPFDGAQARFNVGFDPQKGVLGEALASFAWEHADGYAMGVSYRYLRTIPAFFEDFDGGRFDEFDDNLTRVNQILLTLRIPLFWRFTANYRLAYAFEDGIVLRNQGGLDYVSRCRCWALGFEIRDERERGVQFNVVYKVTGLGKEQGYRGPSEISLSDFSLLDGF